MIDDESSRSGSSGFALGRGRPGLRGRIEAIRAENGTSGLSGAELERRLIELGFVEGACVELLQEGPLGGDPIAVRVGQATFALRRQEASMVQVQPLDEAILPAKELA